MIHFRNPSVQKTPSQFTCGNLDLRVVIKYRYLGLWLHEHLDFKDTASEVAKLLIEHFVFSYQSLSSVEGCLLTVLLYMNL